MPLLEGQYFDEITGKSYFVIAVENQGNGHGTVGVTFKTECGLRASAITMEDGRKGMMLEDNTRLVKSTTS